MTAEEKRIMHYLSVHDLVWINTTVTGKTLRYDYARLEAAIAAQYSYGYSRDVPRQAACFLETLLYKPAFEYGNRRTAFIALTTFLNANGYALKVDDRQAAEILLRVAQGEKTGADAVEELARSADISLHPGVTLRHLVTYICNEHAEALKHLTAGDE